MVKMTLITRKNIILDLYRNIPVPNMHVEIVASRLSCNHDRWLHVEPEFNLVTNSRNMEYQGC